MNTLPILLSSKARDVLAAAPAGCKWCLIIGVVVVVVAVITFAGILSEMHWLRLNSGARGVDDVLDYCGECKLMLLLRLNLLYWLV